MSRAPGISGAGRSAEQRFRETTGAQKPAKAAQGDALLDDYFVEVKKVSKNTINQVRAVKYITLVVWDEPVDEWYVIPPHVIVRLVARKKRGQHGENPFENATLNVKGLDEYRVAESQLRRRTIGAARESEVHPLRPGMKELLRDAQLTAEKARRRVRPFL